MKRLTALTAIGLAAAAVTTGIAFADPTPPPGGGGLQPGEAYAGAGAGPGERGSAGATAVPAGLRGVDVSNHQPRLVDWTGLKRRGVRFAFIKATESAPFPAKPNQLYTNPFFADQYWGARNAGLIRGAYHFAQPHETSGAVQADFFINKGGGWRPGGWTLPGVLDIEPNPYISTNACYNKTPAQNVRWIRDFSNRYRQRTGRLPIIYTNPRFWRECTGGTRAFADHPLWIASHGVANPGTFGGWRTYTFWQYADGGANNPAGSPNVFKGNPQALQRLAAQARTAVSFQARPRNLKRGSKLTVTGQLTTHNGVAWRPLANRRVDVYFLPRGTSRWIAKGKALTDRSGRFRRVYVPQRDGAWRAVFPATPAFLGGTSPANFVDVR